MRSTLQSYRHATTRLLARHERSANCARIDIPLVIEAQHERSGEFLCELLATHSTQLMQDLADNGAVLLRGFEIESTSQFESALLSVQGMQGMGNILNAEPGRDLVDSTRFVMHTNTRHKTGGTFSLGGFHNENFYALDVPRFISFFCRTPSLYGGETGLVDTAALFAELPLALQSRLERETLFAGFVPVSHIARDYGCEAAEVERFAQEVGLNVISHQDERVIALYKPCVFAHPSTGQKSLMFNFTAELASAGLVGAQLEAFLPDYQGRRWALHRLLWRAIIATQPVSLALLRQLAKLGGTAGHTLLADQFTASDVAEFARSIRRNYAAFSWRSGDVLILDNLKTAHGGMPGFGEREIRALLCNPLSMSLVAGAPGLCTPPLTEDRECLGYRLANRRVPTANPCLQTSHRALSPQSEAN